MAKIPNKTGAGGSDSSGRTLDRRDFAIYIVLLLATLAVYSQVRSFDFTSYDDPQYVSANPHVRSGLTREGIVWAFTTNWGANWFPLTWLSHMADFQFFGNRSGLHHLTNVLLHLFSTLLLFALLNRMTGCRWRSGVVAFLFALHPMHVESVAWVAERKDVLSGLFWFLTLWGYLRYVERPRVGRYLLVVLPFCLGLMSKPMIVTLPFVLLLLDVWPLRRLPTAAATHTEQPKRKDRQVVGRKERIAGILWEKAPLLVLSVASGVVTFLVQRGGGAVVPQQWIPLGRRLGNALISYVAYVAKAFWPTRLAEFYPYPSSIPAWQVLGAALILAGISILALRAVRRFPYLAVGWFWYLGTLVPVIGLVQVGMQARADRYSYIPLIGIFLLVAWGIADVLRSKAKTALAVMTGVAGAACIALSWNQVQYWKNSAALYSHAIEAVPGNEIGYYGMGGVYRDMGRLDEAASNYREAIRLAPRLTGAHSGLAGVYLKQDRPEEAVRELTEAIRLSPNVAEDRVSIGVALDKLGKRDDAIAQLLEAIRLDPESADAHYNLGRIYYEMGQVDEALLQFAISVRLFPDNPESHYNLGRTLAAQGKMTEAVAEFTAAIRLKPDYGGAHNNLGSALGNLGRIDEAITHFSEALRLMPGSEEVRRNLEYALSLKKATPKR